MSKERRFDPLAEPRDSSQLVRECLALPAIQLISREGFVRWMTVGSCKEAYKRGLSGSARKSEKRQVHRDRSQYIFFYTHTQVDESRCASDRS